MVRPIDRQFPLEPKVPLDPRMGVGGDHRDEQGAGLDLLTDRGVPGVTATQLALIKPDFDACRAQRRADPLRRSSVFRGVAQKDSSLAALSRRAAAKPLFVRRGVLSSGSF